MWMHQAQEVVGEECTVGAILLYSDKTSILNNQMCYPVYSKFIVVQKHVLKCLRHARTCLKVFVTVLTLVVVPSGSWQHI